MGNCCSTSSENNPRNNNEPVKNPIIVQQVIIPVNVDQVKDHTNADQVKDPINFEEVKNEENKVKDVEVDTKEKNVLNDDNLYRTKSQCDCFNYCKLEWRTDLAFIKDKDTQNWNLNCKQCEKVFTKPGWYCRDHDKSVCEECGIGPGDPILKSPKLLCKKGHALVWAPDIIPYYKMKYNKNKFLCHLCNKPKEEPNWNCRECNYNVCISCGKSKNISPPWDLLKCRNDQNQLIEKTVSKGQSIKCKECSENENDICYSCPECDYSLCYDCSFIRMSKMVQHPGLKCPKDAEILRFEKIKNVTSNLVSCLACNILSVKYGYICDSCEDCYCMNCGNDLAKYIQHATGKLCLKKHSCIEWKPSTENQQETFQCSICEKYFRGGYFYCTKCQMKICLEDIKQIN